MTEHEPAEERHDLHHRTEAEARGKRLATLHHDRRDPAGEAEDAEQAEERRRPDRERRAPVVRFQPKTRGANPPTSPATVPPSAQPSATPHSAKVLATRRGASSLM